MLFVYKWLPILVSFNVCNLSCDSGGVNDIKKHADTPNHKRNEQFSKRKYIDMTLKLKVIPTNCF